MIRSTLTLSRALLFGILTLLIALGCSVVHASHAPDREIHFEREVPASCTTSELTAAFNDLHRWPEWFKTLASVEVAGGEAVKPQAPIQPKAGETLIFHIDSKRSPWSKFDLRVRVVEFEPGKRIHLALLDDSTGRISKLFDRLEWQVELEQVSGKPVVRGSALAHTHHWRSRFIGSFAERALMNQVYYPDVIKLAEITQQNDSFDFVPRSGR